MKFKKYRYHRYHRYPVAVSNQHQVVESLCPAVPCHADLETGRDPQNLIPWEIRLKAILGHMMRNHGFEGQIWRTNQTFVVGISWQKHAKTSIVWLHIYMRHLPQNHQTGSIDVEKLWLEVNESLSIGQEIEQLVPRAHLTVCIGSVCVCVRL